MVEESALQEPKRRGKAFPKGHAKMGGRKKGTQNKFTKSFKDAVLEAFGRLGGVDHLSEWAQRNQSDFYRLAGRLIPTEVQGDPEKPISVNVTFGGRYKP